MEASNSLPSPPGGSPTSAPYDFKNATPKATSELTTVQVHSNTEAEATSFNEMSFRSSKDSLDLINHPAATNGGANAAATGHGRCNNEGPDDITVGNHPSDPFGRALSRFGGEHMIHVSSVSPGEVFPDQNQLLVAHGYAIRLPNGTYTRLIRADTLQGFNIGIPPTQEGSEGLIILPPTELAAPGQVDGTPQYVTAAVSLLNILQAMKLLTLS